MSITDAQKKAVRKYKEKSYDRLEIFVRKGKKEMIKAYAEAHGESVNGLVNRLLDEVIKD